MPLPRPAGPRALWADLTAFARERGSHKWLAGAFAVIMPVVLIVLFVTDGRTNIAPGEQIVYVDNWRADRSDEEIKAAQAERQAQEEARAAERQRQFKELEKRFGL